MDNLTFMHQMICYPY